MSQNPPPQASAMGVLARVISTGAFLIVGLWGAFFWMEAEKEIRVLCDTLTPGAPLESVRATLETGTSLRARLVMDDAGDRLVIDSARNLGQATCLVGLEDERVLESRYARALDVPRMAMLTAVPLLLGMAFLQLALALGAPFGIFAWGGKHVRLPTRLRRRSAVAVVVFAAAIVVVLGARGVVGWIEAGTLEAALWGLAGLFGFSTLANSASGSLVERLTGTPVAFLLCISCAVLALSF
ncbi:MAG: hypothetical protein WEA34_11655 [Gemmatimonadota bacterium]